MVPVLSWIVGAAIAAAADGAPPQPSELFATSDNCMACHNGLRAPGGEDVSIGVAWRGSIMANSARDPYFQAAVRREVLDHPSASHEIEDECSVCHMPMARTAAHSAGREGQVFAHLPVARPAAAAEGGEEARLAADGVSCTLCHQVAPEKLGTSESFNGGYAIDFKTPPEQRRIYGPFQVASGLQSVMRSVTGFRPQEGLHIRNSELCATCHTLYTKTRGPDGAVIAQLPEQMIYLEWRHSSFEREQSCQSCHMTPVGELVPITSVLGAPRAGLHRHVFVGGNFLMLKMLNRYRKELGVVALPEELEASAARTLRLLGEQTAGLAIERAQFAGGRLAIEVAVENRSGHKLPTAYPSRRAWIHLVVRDRAGVAVFESGALSPSGAIQGNDGDGDRPGFEPHYREITRGDQVQIYESVMEDAAGQVTTGLLSAVRYVKDNRLLPRGFEKSTAAADIAVQGDASTDADFMGGRDSIRYTVGVADREGPFRIEAELRYQPIGFRWAQNLKRYSGQEPERFVGYYEAMAESGAALLARVSLEVR